MVATGIRPGGTRALARTALVLAVLTLPAAGLARTMRDRMEAACADDIRRLCPDGAPGSDALKACLLANRPRVSSACMTFVDASE